MSRVVHFVGTIENKRFRVTAYAKDLDIVRYDNEVSVRVCQEILDVFELDFIEVHDD